jgi:hypothetical protein
MHTLEQQQRSPTQAVVTCCSLCHCLRRCKTSLTCQVIPMMSEQTKAWHVAGHDLPHRATSRVTVDATGSAGLWLDHSVLVSQPGSARFACSCKRTIATVRH